MVRCESKGFQGKGLHGGMGKHLQWSLVNQDAINLDASLSGRYFWGTNCIKIYQM
jgi:hypothetical protein